MRCGFTVLQHLLFCVHRESLHSLKHCQLGLKITLMDWLKIPLTEFTGYIAANSVQVWLCKAVDYSVRFYELCCSVIFLIFVQSSWESYQSNVQCELQHCHLSFLILFDPNVLVVGTLLKWFWTVLTSRTHMLGSRFSGFLLTL